METHTLNDKINIIKNTDGTDAIARLSNREVHSLAKSLSRHGSSSTNRIWGNQMCIEYKSTHKFSIKQKIKTVRTYIRDVPKRGMEQDDYKPVSSNILTSQTERPASNQDQYRRQEVHELMKRYSS